MLRIKSAQYMNMPPKALPMQFDDNAQNPKCKFQDCINPSKDFEDFCEDCLSSGSIKQCSQCFKNKFEDDGSNTSDELFLCNECQRDFQVGSRQDYYNNTYENYEN